MGKRDITKATIASKSIPVAFWPLRSDCPSTKERIQKNVTTSTVVCGFYGLRTLSYVRAVSKEFLAEMRNISSDDDIQFLAHIEIVYITAHSQCL
jgi:hypothetical protein